MVLLSPLVVSAQSVGDYAVFSAPGLPGRLFVPPSAAVATSPRPFILALHGGGGIGTDNVNHLIDFEGLLAAARVHQAFLYAPQATSAYWHAGNRPALIMSMIDAAIAQYPIDPARIYVTGFSMGGGGTWNMLARYSSRFAAGVPICGIAPGDGYDATKLVEKPIWAFHARNDSTVSVQTSRGTLNGILQAAGATGPAFPPTNDTTTTLTFAHATLPLSYTEWPTGGHAIWFRVYTDAALLDWLFAQSLLPPPGITTHPVSATVTPGDGVMLSVEAESSAALSYQWTKNGVPIAGATLSTLSLTGVTSSADGYYAVNVSNAAGATTSRPARLLVAAPEPGRLINLSIRGRAGIGGQPLIVGFVAAGGSKPLLLRAIGPSLAEFDVTDRMSDPRLDVHALLAGQDVVVAGNDQWSGDVALVQASASAGAFPLDDTLSHDAALLINVDGQRTVHVGAASGAPGVVLAELYDTAPENAARLANLSARNLVGAGDDVLIAGFVISGNMPRRVLIRGIGPGLTDFDVANALLDPRLEVHTKIDAVDTVIAANDDWESELTATEMAAAVPGAFALAPGSKDAVILHTLPAGAFTAVVSGFGGATGEALVEVYEAD